MGRNVTRKLIDSHLLSGKATPGEEIGLRIDQTLTQDATGTLVMLELEAMGLDRVRTELSAQYVDHNLLQTDFKNSDDHLFLQSACQRFGIWYSPAGNGVSHPVHMETFGVPGKTLLGSDSHTPAGGALGMLALGAGGLEVALAMAGEPLFLRMPEVWGIRLVGALPDWVSAKDVILELLRRHDVDGGRGRILEYFGPGLENLSAMDRHVIANMGTELGATSSVFPADDEVRSFLRLMGREGDSIELTADGDATYDLEEEIDLGALEPLIACPSSPGNVVAVREVAGREIYQAMVGSSANPGFRDFAVVARILEQRRADPTVSLDVNPTSRRMLRNLAESGDVGRLLDGGARIHQPGCNGCIGMGQAPASGRISLRTVPRNFPGRSGTREDQVYLCSPETAVASAITGRITDPRSLGLVYPRDCEPREWVEVESRQHLIAPSDGRSDLELLRGPNIKSLPVLDPLASELAGPVLLKVGDDVSTDEILPAGSRVLPFRSNIPELARFAFSQIDDTFHRRATEQSRRTSIVVGGDNYGQGSSREHAALVPRFLGVRVVLVKSFARIHWQNLANFGIVPLTFRDPADYDRVEQGDELRFPELRRRLEDKLPIAVVNVTRELSFPVEHRLSDRQLVMVLAGSALNLIGAAVQ
jgi:aconitate hydratase